MQKFFALVGVVAIVTLTAGTARSWVARFVCNR